jgi:DNA-directed RNA polymerase subunit N (RpoN/RPB10)
MGADAGYCGLITKNPLHEDWRVWSISSERYELNELAEYVDLESFSDQRRALPEIGLGRNCSLFEKLRLWSYRAIRQGWPDYPQFLRACEDRALAYNTNLETPLPIQEIGHIAKSVAKWTHTHFTPSQFSEMQAYRGSQGGKAKGKAYQTKKERALQMLSEGKTQKEVSEELGIHRNTVRNYKMHK